MKLRNKIKRKNYREGYAVSVNGDYGKPAGPAFHNALTDSTTNYQVKAYCQGRLAGFKEYNLRQLLKGETVE